MVIPCNRSYYFRVIIYMYANMYVVPINSKVFPMKESTPRTFGQWVKSKRKKAGMTQIELAEKMGVTQGYVSGIETDSDREITRRVAISFAVGLGLDQGDGLVAAGYRIEDNSDDDDKRVSSQMVLAAGVEFLLDTREGILRGTLSEKNLRAVAALLDLVEPTDTTN